MTIKLKRGLLDYLILTRALLAGEAVVSKKISLAALPKVKLCLSKNEIDRISQEASSSARLLDRIFWGKLFCF